jgi:hypothetical protein
VAEFGLVLRGAPGVTLSSAIQHAEQSLGGDKNGERARFVQLLQKAQAVAF